MFANNFHWSLTCFWQTFLGFQSDGLFNMGTLTLKAFNISKRSLYGEKINAKQWNSEGAEIKIVGPQSYTVVEICLRTKASVWSKTSLNTGGVGGTGEDPPTCKMETFFMSLTLTEPIFNNFQLNGAKMF